MGGVPGTFEPGVDTQEFVLRNKRRGIHSFMCVDVHFIRPELSLARLFKRSQAKQPEHPVMGNRVLPNI